MQPSLKPDRNSSTLVGSNLHPVFIRLCYVLGYVLAPFLLCALMHLDVELVVLDLPNLRITRSFVVLRGCPCAVAVILGGVRDGI